MHTKLFQFGSIEATARAVNWGMMMFLPLLVSDSEYGEISLFLSLLGICGAIMGLGLDRAVVRFYEPDSDSRAVIKEVALIETGLFLVLLLIALGVTDSLKGHGTGVLPTYLIPIVCCAYLQNCLTLGVAVSRVERSRQLLLLVRLCPQIIQFLFIVAAVTLFSTPSLYIFAIGGSLFIFFLIEAALFLRRGLLGLKGITLQSLMRIIALCWPFLFLTAASFTHAQIDRILIARYMNLAEVGAYSLYYTFGSSINFVFAIIMFSLEPKVYRGKTSAEVFRSIRSIGSSQLAVGAFIGIIICLLGQDLLQLVYSKSFESSYDTVIVILAAHLIQPLYLMGNMGLMYRSRTKMLIWGIVPSALCNIFLNMVLIPKYGIRGAAIATLVSYLLLGSIVYGSFVYHFRDTIPIRAHRIFLLCMLLLMPLVALIDVPWFRVFTLGTVSLLMFSEAGWIRLHFLSAHLHPTDKYVEDN